MIDIILFLVVFFAPLIGGAYAGHRAGKAEKRAAARRYGRRS